MESTRLQKINRLIQKELGELFLLQTKAIPGTMVSVTSVRTTTDLSITRVYLSFFPSEKADELLKNIKQNTKSIRYDLGQRIRLQIRKIPELTFFKDDTLDYLENIDNLLNKQ